MRSRSPARMSSRSRRVAASDALEGVAPNEYAALRELRRHLGGRRNRIGGIHVETPRNVHETTRGVNPIGRRKPCFGKAPSDERRDSGIPHGVSCRLRFGEREDSADQTPLRHKVVIQLDEGSQCAVLVSSTQSLAHLGRGRRRIIATSGRRVETVPGACEETVHRRVLRLTTTFGSGHGRLVDVCATGKLDLGELPTLAGCAEKGRCDGHCCPHSRYDLRVIFSHERATGVNCRWGARQRRAGA